MRTSSGQRTYEFGDFRLDADHLMLYRGTQEVPLAPKAVETLLALVERSGEIVRKEELIERIWPDSFVDESNLFLYLSVLRKTLGQQQDGTPFLETLRRRGYRFNGQVQIVREGHEENRGAGLDDTLAVVERTLPEAASEGPGRREGPRPGRWLALAAVLLAAISAGALYWRGGPLAGAGADAPRAIAILPFTPLVADDSRDPYLELGMADALIARLGGRREVLVRPLSSVREFGGLDRDAVAAGRALGVDVVLDGQIQKAGGQIRVHARLIRVTDATPLWTHTFNGTYGQVLALQNEMSDRIAAAIELRLPSNEKAGAVERYTEDVEAWEHYLRGSYQVGRVTPRDIQKSIEHYQKAIDRDPDYALAYAGLARAYISLPPSSDFPPTECFQKAKAAAHKALDIDNRLAEGHSVLGAILFWYDWDWSGSEKQCRRAIDLDPNSADAHYTYAHLLSNTGRHAEALAEMKRARELDPINLRITALEAQFLLHAGRTDDAGEKLRKTVTLSPKFWLGHLFLSSLYIEQGMYAEAVAAADAAHQTSGASNHPLAFKGYALAKAGKKPEAQLVLSELTKQSNERFVPPYYFALIYNGLGETETAISWLERGLEQRDSKMVFLRVEPKWGNLRSHPRFITLLRQMKLE